MRLAQSGLLQCRRKRDLPSVSQSRAKIRLDEIEFLRLLEQIQRSMHRLDNALADLEAVLWTERRLKVQPRPSTNPIGII